MDDDDDDDDDDDMDLFGEATEEEKAARQKVIDEAKKRGEAKAKLTKSMIVLDVKPWDDTTGVGGYLQLHACCRAVQRVGSQPDAGLHGPPASSWGGIAGAGGCGTRSGAQPTTQRQQRALTHSVRCRPGRAGAGSARHQEGRPFMGQQCAPAGPARCGSHLPAAPALAAQRSRLPLQGEQRAGLACLCFATLHGTVQRL